MKKHFKSLQMSLFSRTFFLLTLLIIINVIIWIHAVQSIVDNHHLKKTNLISRTVRDVHYTLTHVDSENTRYEIIRLQDKYGIVISPEITKNYGVEYIPATYIANIDRIKLDFIKKQLEPSMAFQNNNYDSDYFWGRIQVKDHYYWIGFNPDTIQPAKDVEWLAWLFIAITVSLLGATFIVKLVNTPILRLAQATTLLMHGQTPQLLPEVGSDEVKVMNTSFNNLVEQLSKAEEDRSLMLAGISHDLRTPLTRIRLELEMLNLDENTRQAVEEDVEQIDRTIKQFMDYARPQRNTPDLINITLALREIAARESLYTQQAKGELHYSIAENLNTRIDPADLERILANLIENARRYAQNPNRSLKIYLIAYQSMGQIVIDVSDNGPGIPQEKHHAMIQPFVRGSDARSNASGTGLGLAIVHRLVQRIGGELRIGKSSMDGCKVSIRLALMQD